MADDISNVDETEEVEAEETAEGAAGESKQDDGAESLGDAGKKALDAMKAKWRAERDKAKAAEAKLAELSKPKPADDEKPDLDALRAQAREEARADALKERALDRLEAKAARLFQDPEDARAYLAGNVDDFIDGQSIDNDAILEALEDLLKKKPYLGVTQGEEKRFKGSGDQGPKKTAGKPQLTEDQVKQLYKDKRYDEITRAQDAGQLNELLGIQS